jgi:DNA-binding CsgD family transcriptional regulator
MSYQVGLKHERAARRKAAQVSYLWNEGGMSAQQIADYLGKSTTYVYAYMKIAREVGWFVSEKING